MEKQRGAFTTRLKINCLKHAGLQEIVSKPHEIYGVIFFKLY